MQDGETLFEIERESRMEKDDGSDEYAEGKCDLHFTNHIVYRRNHTLINWLVSHFISPIC